MHDSEWYKLRYFATLDDAEALIERWRRGIPQTRTEQDAVWVWASETIHRLARNHYKRQQNTSRWQWHQLHGIESEHDGHNERVLSLLNMLASPDYSHRTAVWIIAAYRRRFAQLEALHQLRDLGVGMTDWGEPIHEQSVPVIAWVFCAKLERGVEAKGLDVTNETLYAEWVETEQKYNRHPTPTRFANFQKKYAWYRELKQLAHRKPYQSDSDIPEYTSQRRTSL